MAQNTTPVPFIEPPRITGDPVTDLAGVAEYLWEFYNSAILSGGLLQPAQVPDELTSQFPILANLGAVVGAEDTLPYLTGADTWAITAFLAFGRSLVGSADAAAARTVLALGAVAVLNSISTAFIDDDAVTYAKIQNVSATDRLLGRSTAGAGNVEEITCTAAGRAILDDADAAAQRSTLGLGTAAAKNTGASGDAVPLLNVANTWSEAQTYSKPPIVPSYTVAGVPSASPAAQIAYISNGVGGAVLAFSDGANWRRVTDRSVIA